MIFRAYYTETDINEERNISLKLLSLTENHDVVGKLGSSFFNGTKMFAFKLMNIFWNT